jgi:prepilin-type N-terminal cleavage/methylation domain-containing protein
MRLNLNVHTPSMRRHGFTLIELMVVMVLLSVVVGGLIKVIAGQQRFYRSAGDLMESRSQIRQAISLLPTDLRGMSTVGSDILSASDTSIQFRATIGASAVCTANAGARTFNFPPNTLSSGQVISAGRVVATAGDFLAVYDDGASPGRSDDTWVVYTIRDVQMPVATCPGTPFVSAADQLRQGYVITVVEPISVTIVQGAPARILRQVEYRLYRAGDGKSYLGYIECPGGACTAIQPVSGPYRDYVGAGNANNGLQIQYFDSLGAEISGAALAVRANLNNVARLQITVRGQTASALSVPGLAPAKKQDELTVQVGVRNRQ